MMFEFVLVVVAANLIILAGLYFLRHIIAIRAPVLFMALGISLFLCILYPFIVVWVMYPKVIYLYGAFILAGSAVLYAVENRFFSAERPWQGEMTGLAVGEIMAAIEGGPAVEVNPAPFQVAAGKTGGGLTGTPGPADLSAYKKDLEATVFPEPAVQETEVPEVVVGEPETDQMPEVTEVAPAVEISAEIEVPAEADLAVEAEVQDVREFPVPDQVLLLADYSVMDTAQDENLSSVHPETAVPPSGDSPIIPGDAVSPQAGDNQIKSLVARAFDTLESGDKLRAAEMFFQVLKLNPPPKLAAMLCIEISSIYLSGGRARQALAVAEMVREVWGAVLDDYDLDRLENTLIQLRREVQ